MTLSMKEHPPEGEIPGPLHPYAPRVFASVFHLLVARLPPNCSRTRPEDAKTWLLRPGCTWINTCKYGEGGFEPPVPVANNRGELSIDRH